MPHSGGWGFNRYKDRSRVAVHIANIPSFPRLPMNYPQSGLLPGGAQLTEGNGEPVRTGWDLRASDYCDLCGIVILYWDHILTFPTEVKYLWKRPRFTSAYLFFLNRYFNTFANVIVIFSLFGPRSFLESTECKPLEDLREGIIIVTQVIVMIIMTLRIYAIYGCNKRLLRVLIGILILLLAGAAVATFYEAGEEEIASIRCHTPRDRIRAMSLTNLANILTFYHLRHLGISPDVALA
ncbi:hypothetical protein WG66_009423 [Moniliophthora roreri]|nr:hypothetical protein WG66_009423 [Moniliophthora roreri]